MASALPVISREEINFLRVANLLIRHSPKAVRILFNREFNPSGLTSVLSKNRNKLDKLKKKHVITQTQWSLLFPSGSVPDSSHFDLTLMVCLLRNLTKITIQDKLPQPSDLSEGAAVSRIKYYRNQIAHSDSGALSDLEFSKTFDEVSMAIEIICPPMKTDCETLKDAHIDHSVHDIYLEFVKNEKQMEEMKQKHDELVAQVEVLKVERQNLECLAKTILTNSPSEQQLSRFADQLTSSSCKELMLHLGLQMKDWEDIEDCYTGMPLIIRIMVLHSWKTKRIEGKPTKSFSDLLDALKAVGDERHLLCKVFREDTDLLDIADVQLQEVPRDDVLNDLPKNLGNCAIQLGIELGITISSIKETIVRYRKDMYDQISDILRKWKSSREAKPTIYRLMLALERVDTGGLDYLKGIYLRQ